MDITTSCTFAEYRESLVGSSVGSPRSSHLSCGDAYFSADVETDGPIPGPYSMLSFAMVYAGSFDGRSFVRPRDFNQVFYAEIRPISDRFEEAALKVNRIDRENLIKKGEDPAHAMNRAHKWITEKAVKRKPVLVAYPVSFDWTWLYWYFIAFCQHGSPFNYSRCYDIKTAMAVKTKTAISETGRSKLPFNLQSSQEHTHHAVDDAKEQAEIFANIFEWSR